MLFKLTNDTQSQRHVWAWGRQTLISPGEAKTLDLNDNNAVFLRRCEKRGDLFRIEATNAEGESILARANQPPVKGNYPRGLGPDVGNPGEIRDGVEEARLEQQAKIMELARQPDPGMRTPQPPPPPKEATTPARVPRG
jgi:hypothetical protein